MSDHAEDYELKKKLYLKIGIVLFIFTVVTVAVATVPFLDFGGHGFDTADMVIGLAIATFKASLVMLIFMHLNHEKKLIYFIFFFMAGGGAISLMFLTGWAFADPIKYGTPSKMDNTPNSVDGFYIPPQAVHSVETDGPVVITD